MASKPNLPVEFLWSNWRQLGALAGLVAVILAVIGFILIGDYPDYRESPATVRDWYADNQDSLMAANYLFALAFIVFFVPFLVALRSYLGIAEGGRGGWSRLALVGGILTVLWLSGGSVFAAALGRGAGAGSGSDAVVTALATLDYVVYAAAPIVVAVFLFASGAVVLRTGVPWGTSGVLGVALAILGVIAAAGPIDGDPDGVFTVLAYITFIGLGVWTLILSAGMVMKEPAAAG
jgi:hypothetical protein